MYYYILDYNQSQPFLNFQRKLKEILTNLNIAGEMAISSPARGAEEVAQMALERGYTTIVAVGGDLLVNRLASVLAGTQAALGLIPYNVSSEIGELFCGKDVKSASIGLKQRKTAHIDLGQVKSNKFFLSDLVIETEKPVKCVMEVDDKFTLESTSYKVVISRDLSATLQSQEPNKNTSWWKRPGKLEEPTSLKAKQFINLYTAAPVSVTLCDAEIIKTPIKVSTAKGVLKIIVNRDTIS